MMDTQKVLVYNDSLTEIDIFTFEEGKDIDKEIENLRELEYHDDNSFHLMDNYLVLSEDMFNALKGRIEQIDAEENPKSRLKELEEKAWENITGEDVANALTKEEAEEYYKLLGNQ
jgi:hypothetical protein